MAIFRKGSPLNPIVHASKKRFKELYYANLLADLTEEAFVDNEIAVAEKLETLVDQFSLVEVMFCIARLQFIDPSEVHTWYWGRMTGEVPPNQASSSIPSFGDGLFANHQTGRTPGVLRNPSVIGSTQQFHIIFAVKMELLTSLVSECRNSKQQLVMSANDKSATRKKSLACFDKFEELSKEDCIWAAERLVEYIFTSTQNCQASVLCAYHDIVSGNLSNEESVAALQSMELLWWVPPAERELFALKFRPQLAQRKCRKKKKESNKVALNTTISEERKVQLDELSEIKGKPQYKVLEELIYHAYKECKR